MSAFYNKECQKHQIPYWPTTHVFVNDVTQKNRVGQILKYLENNKPEDTLFIVPEVNRTEAKYVIIELHGSLQYARDFWESPYTIHWWYRVVGLGRGECLIAIGFIGITELAGL